MKLIPKRVDNEASEKQTIQMKKSSAFYHRVHMKSEKNKLLLSGFFI